MGLSLTLPYPPSINHYWRTARGRTYISDEGRKYRASVSGILARLPIFGPLTTRLAVSIKLNPPDRRRRDIDNVQKPLLDALQHGGAYVDDSQIDWLLTERGEVLKGGQVVVNISTISGVGVDSDTLKAAL